VAKELKLTDTQKAKLKTIADVQNKKRTEVFQNLRQQTDMAKAQAQQLAEAEALQQGQIDPSVDARGSGAGNPLAGALNGRGYQPQVFGGRVQGGVDPALQQQAAQFQGRQAANAVQAQSREMMREAMQALQQESEGALAKILNKTQVKRLKEIQLQVQGPSAVLRDDVAEKLEITDDQRAEIQNVLNEGNAARRQIMQKNMQLFRTIMPNQPGGGNPPGAGAPDPNGGAPDPNGADPAAGQAGGPGGAGGRSGRGGRGGPGGPGGPGGRPMWSAADMQKIMERPDVKAKMDETRKEQSELRDKEYAMIFKAMDRGQVSSFKRMLGKAFDVDSVLGGFFRGPQGGPRNGQNGNGNQPPATAAAKAAPAAKADSNASATSKASSTPKRQSLRDRRGLGGQQPAPDSGSPN
jgi:hypothetical protein